MITEDYVSFKTAKLLKEKGFNWGCKRMFRALKSSTPKVYDYSEWVTNQDLCDLYQNCEFAVIPTLQMAMKWLREVHKVEVRVFYDIDKTTWWGGCNPMYEENEENSNMFQSLLGFDYPGKTYEEACEAAIRYTLENLI